MNFSFDDDGVLGLDIDTRHIGWALVRGTHHVTGHGRFRRDDFPKFLLMYSKWLRDLVQEQQPAVIAIESAFVGLPTAVAPLYEIHGATKLTLATFRGAIGYVANKSWKSDICGNGNILTKDKKARKIVAICNEMGFAVDQIDEADALCVALHMRKKLTGRVV